MGSVIPRQTDQLKSNCMRNKKVKGNLKIFVEGNIAYNLYLDRISGYEKQ